MKRNNEIRKIITTEYLTACIDKGISARQIAKMHNVSDTFINTIAKELGIKFPKVNYNNISYKRYRINDAGYIVLSIGNDTYELEHRIVVQNYIKRAVRPDESIHHINGNRKDNSPRNLLLLDKKLHDAFHTYCRNHGIPHTERSVKTILEQLNYNIRVEMYAELMRITEA